ncbi:hypothetical protein K504DRAFT_468727 [Pleomassaria siparia CBS 279.74]|uniref:Uncharacterized protein n=1 Tax=Pleomassaria siparia CBS 279.74 TaxID=1314801 RepID=A0A6G1K7E3_9PLEO|nr:hypothetical protein K504DRAFT_468727 [Pleomassaria siparia CBS 279.74]
MQALSAPQAFQRVFASPVCVPPCTPEAQQQSLMQQHPSPNQQLALFSPSRMIRL